MSRPRVAADTIVVPVADESVVWVASTGALHLLDPVATTILDVVQQGGDASVVDRTAAVFGQDPEVVRADVEAFLQRMTAAGVLEP